MFFVGFVSKKHNNKTQNNKKTHIEKTQQKKHHFDMHGGKDLAGHCECLWEEPQGAYKSGLSQDGLSQNGLSQNGYGFI